MNWKNFSRTSLLLVSICLSSFSYAEAVWIDVRSSFEHMMGSIEGDTHIPHGDIVEGVTKQFPDKNTEIHLYCASGGRSGNAMSALEEAGYTNLSNAGGIDDARKARGLAD